VKSSIAIIALLLSACGVADAEPKAASKWRFEVKGAAVSYSVVAPDGDVIVAGGIKGSAKFGSQALQSDDDGVWVARLASSGGLKWVNLVDPTTKKYVQQYVSSLSVAADGSVRVGVHRREAPYLRRVTITADGATQTVDALVPETKIMTSSGFVNGDALVSAEPGPKDKCKGAMLQRLAPGGKRVWSTCTKVEVGALHRTSVLADGRSALCANEWIGEFSTKGKRAWEAKHPDERWCQSIALFESGDVVAVFDEAPTTTAMLWKANGKLGWTKKCTDLVKGSGSCLLDGLAVRGTDAILTVRNGPTTLIAVLDGKTGAVKKTYPLEIDASIRPVTATDSAIIFGTISPSGFTVESLDR
jgi:hypothetical protein